MTKAKRSLSTSHYAQHLMHIQQCTYLQQAHAKNICSSHTPRDVISSFKIKPTIAPTANYAIAHNIETK